MTLPPLFPLGGTLGLEGKNVNPAKTHLLKEYKHESPLLGCRFDPSGQFVFAGAQDNNVVRWNLDNGKKTLLISHKSWVRAVAFSAGSHAERGNQKLLFSGDYAGRILAWPVDGEQPRPIRTIEGHRGFVRALAVSPDGTMLA